MLKRLFPSRDMTNDEWAAAQAEWHNPRNWHVGFYYAPRDPHVWVRKPRVEFGWTPAPVVTEQSPRRPSVICVYHFHFKGHAC